MELPRRFTDGRGVEWRVWRAGPDPAPRPVGSFAPPERCPEGALCFESALERRYLLRYPAEWEQLSDDALELLCGQAQVVPIRQSDETTGQFMRRQDELFDATLGRRTFATPDNRVWLVEENADRHVLRFSSGDAVRELDLRARPASTRERGAAPPPLAPRPPSE
jgi:hypothetical protein